MIHRLLTQMLLANQAGILLYFLGLNLMYMTFIIRAFLAIRRHQEEVAVEQLENTFECIHYKPVTLICPAFNESLGIVGSVNSLLGLRYPEIQLIVVNDGSKDDTLAKLIQAFHLKPSYRVVRHALPAAPIRGIYECALLPNLLVVDKENGGKADALNCGLNLAIYPLICCMDGDSHLERDALIRGTRPFFTKPHVVATAGVIRPLNGCKITPMGIRGIALPDNWLARLQVVEYLRAFLYGRMGLADLNCLFIVSGAFGVFRRDVLLEVGGFHKTIGEDFELVVRVHHRMMDKGAPYRMVMVPDPVCWTEVPEDIGSLRRQRNRWQRGLMDSLWLHREMWFNPDYGVVGMFSMPYFLIFEGAAPIIEATGYAFFVYASLAGKTHFQFAIAFFFVALFLGVFNGQLAVILEQITERPYQGMGDWWKLLLCCVTENFGYRQRTLWWRLLGCFDWLRGKEAWGLVKRRVTTT